MARRIRLRYVGASTGKIAELPTTSAELLDLATKKLKLAVAAARIFAEDGDEYDDDDIHLIGQDDLLYVSCGEDFATTMSKPPPPELLGHALVRVDAMEMCFNELNSRVEARMSVGESKMIAAEQLVTAYVESKFAALEATIAKLVADAEARSAAREASVKAAEQVIKGKFATFEQQVQETATSATMAMQKKGDAMQAQLANAEQLVERRLAALEKRTVALQEEVHAARAVAVQAHQAGVSCSSEAIMVYTSRRFSGGKPEGAEVFMNRHAQQVQAALAAHPSLRVVGHALNASALQDPQLDFSSVHQECNKNNIMLSVHSLLGR